MFGKKKGGNLEEDLGYKSTPDTIKVDGGHTDNQHTDEENRGSEYHYYMLGVDVGVGVGAGVGVDIDVDVPNINGLSEPLDDARSLDCSRECPPHRF